MYNYYVKLADARLAIMDYIGEQTVSKYASAADCKLARDGAEGAMNALDYMPPADVVPKSEVDLYRKQVDELEDELASTYDKLEKAKAEVAMEIFAEIEKKSCVISETNHSTGSTRVVSYQISAEKLAELKKKYTEGE